MRFKVVEQHWDKDDQPANLELFVEADAYELDGPHGSLAKFFRDGKLVLAYRTWDWIEAVEEA